MESVLIDPTQWAELMQHLSDSSHNIHMSMGFISGCILAIIVSTTWKG